MPNSISIYMIYAFASAVGILLTAFSAAAWRLWKIFREYILIKMAEKYQKDLIIKKGEISLKTVFKPKEESIQLEEKS